MYLIHYQLYNFHFLTIILYSTLSLSPYFYFTYYFSYTNSTYVTLVIICCTYCMEINEIKLMIPAFQLSCDWRRQCMSPPPLRLMYALNYLERITSDAISRTAFGSSYQQGRRIFDLQKQQGRHVMEVLQLTYLPVPKYYNYNINSICITPSSPLNIYSSHSFYIRKEYFISIKVVFLI